MQHAARRAFKMEEPQGMSCQQHSVGRPQGASCRDLSDNLPTTDVAIKDEAQPMGPYLGLWIFFAMAGLVTTGRSKVANCGNGGRDAWLPVQEGPAASSSSSAPGRWAAVTALETAARERVLGWRLERGLEDDADFAYRWASHEEAIAGAGHAVAHEWLRVRAEQTITLLPAVAQVIDDLPKPSPSVVPAILREYVWEEEAWSQVEGEPI